MIKEGFCWDFGFKYPNPRGEEYLKAHKEAEKTETEIWK